MNLNINQNNIKFIVLVAVVIFVLFQICKCLANNVTENYDLLDGDSIDNKFYPQDHQLNYESVVKPGKRTYKKWREPRYNEIISPHADETTGPTVGWRYKVESEVMRQIADEIATEDVGANGHAEVTGFEQEIGVGVEGVANAEGINEHFANTGNKGRKRWIRRKQRKAKVTVEDNDDKEHVKKEVMRAIMQEAAPKNRKQQEHFADLIDSGIKNNLQSVSPKTGYEYSHELAIKPEGAKELFDSYYFEPYPYFEHDSFNNSSGRYHSLRY